MDSLGIVGHIAIDRIIDDRGVRLQLGGSPTYASLVTNVLGVDLHVCTKVGADFPVEYEQQLKARRIDVSPWKLNNEKTTRFVLDYTGAERKLRIESICAPILPPDLEELPYAVMLTPIIGELSSEVVESISSRLLALDPQGFLRQIVPGGDIVMKHWADKKLFARLSVLKASESELSLITGLTDVGKGLLKLTIYGVDVAIVTMGGGGVRLAYGRKRLELPAYPTKLIDLTGAGDAFLSGFFYEYIRGSPIEWCASIATSAASAVIETVGPSILIDKNTIYDRAEWVMDHIKRLK